MDEVEERLEDVEVEISRLDERVGSRAIVKAFDAMDMSFGGFVDMAVTHASGEDSSVTSFNRQVFELLFGATLKEDWELFVAQAFIRKTGVDLTDRRNPDFSNLNSPVATDTVLASITHKVNDRLDIQIGRFITPQGIINIEHFPALLLDTRQPQFLRPFAKQTIFPNFSNGINVKVHTYFKGSSDHSLKYYLYSGSFSGNSTHFNLGTRLAYQLGGLTVGINGSEGERSSQFDSDYNVWGIDFLYDRGVILWKNEFFKTNEDLGLDRTGYYSQPAVRMGESWTLFYRYDRLEAGSDPATLIERDNFYAHSLGLVYNPNKNVRLRAIVTRKNLEATMTEPAAKAWLAELSATLSF